jgi:transcription elongation GreA/GreB family factor
LEKERSEPFVERRLYQGRECRDRSRNPAAGSPDFAARQPGHRGGAKLLERQLAEARAAYEAAQSTEDVNEKRRLSAIPLRDIRYFSERLRTAQVQAAPSSADVVAFGNTVTFSRADGRVQTFRIVGEDEADQRPARSRLPVAGRSQRRGETAGSGGNELEIIAVAAAFFMGLAADLWKAKPRLAVAGVWSGDLRPNGRSRRGAQARDYPTRR